MSIRSRILIPMVIISVLAASTILFFNIMQFSSFVDNYIEAELDRAVLKAIDEIEGLKMKSHTAVLYYSNDNELIEAMSRSDQESVLKRAKQLFAQTDVESLTIVDDNAIVLARGHEPELYGDDTSGLPVVRSTLEGEAALGAARGISTSISVRAATPLYNIRGSLVGALFAGDRLDTEEFVDRLKTFTGCEITVIVDDVRVATTLYGADGKRATDTEVPGYIENAVLSGEGVTRQASFLGREIVEMHVPVVDGNGNIIALVSAGKYLTEKQEMETSFIAAGFFITVIFIVFSILIILFVSRRIAMPISRSINLANYDKLTGIFNRRFLEEHLELLLKNMSRTGGIVSLLMIDIDFFKNYNDTYGHIKGDDCLRAVAEVLTQTVSRADDFIARYGGEEFVAVLPYTDETGARDMAAKLLEAVHKRGIPHEESSVADRITVSIGATTGYTEHIPSGIDLIRQADYMLYESKRNGRNMYTFSAMNEKV